MALRVSAVLEFADYDVRDEGIELHFVCADPGPGEASDYRVLLSEAEVAGVTDLASFRALALAKLGRKLRAAGIASRLDALRRQSVVV